MEIFEIDPGLFIWSVITFLLLVGLLYKFAFNPLMRMQRARQDETRSLSQRELKLEMNRQLEVDGRSRSVYLFISAQRFSRLLGTNAPVMTYIRLYRGSWARRAIEGTGMASNVDELVGRVRSRLRLSVILREVFRYTTAFAIGAFAISALSKFG